MCACCGTRGRSTGISLAAEILSRRITWVTYSSLRPDPGRPSATGTEAERASLFWMMRTTPPELTAV
jgi:hypothetical protein